MAAVFSSGGVVGVASSWSLVTEASPIPLSAAASTGNETPRWK